MKCPKCGHQMRVKVVKVRRNPIATATGDEPHYGCIGCGYIRPKG